MATEDVRPEGFKELGAATETVRAEVVEVGAADEGCHGGSGYAAEMRGCGDVGRLGYKVGFGLETLTDMINFCLNLQWTLDCVDVHRKTRSPYWRGRKRYIDHGHLEA